MVVKVNAPYITDEEVQEVIKVLRSGNLAAGEYVRLFEDSFAKYLGVKHALTVSNGTVALYLTLKAVGVGPGDEVAVPDFTFAATATSVVLAGGKVVPVDIDLETYNMDPNDLKERLTERTKAVVLVHLYGHPADVDSVKEVLDNKNIFLIEDCAQSHGAEYKGVKTGSLGVASAFSFYATKNLTMGEGGAVVTNEDYIAEYVKLQRNHGQVEKYLHSVIGWNFRITELQAALGYVQLAKLDKMNERRRAIAKIYGEELSSIRLLKLPTEKPYAKHVYHQYTVWVHGNGVRDKLSEFLRNRGVQTAIHYPNPIHKQPALREHLVLSKKLYNSVEASRHVLSLPMHPGLIDEDVLMITKYIKEFFRDLKT
ncbi:MAG: DegT/DnrJ/EryC1/StrS family aminotransferase [Desulfurococcaceae archaeon TW002]